MNDYNKPICWWRGTVSDFFEQGGFEPKMKCITMKVDPVVNQINETSRTGILQLKLALSARWLNESKLEALPKLKPF